MSTSWHVKGIVPANDKWKKMAEAWRACDEAGIDPPKEVQEFFGWEEPDEAGVVLDEDKLGKAVTDWKDDGREGYEIDLSQLPKHVTKLRFYISW